MCKEGSTSERRIVKLILLKQGRLAVSNLGWADHGALWTYDIGANRERSISLSDAWSLQLVEGTDDHFAVVHKWDAGDRAIVAVHSVAALDRAVASLTFDSSGVHFGGERRRWQFVPRAFVVYRGSGDGPGRGYFLLVIRDGGDVDIQRMDWFNSSNYDLGYSSVLGATEVPDSHLLLMPVQRDSNPVLYDPQLRRPVGKITLANRAGNPQLRFRRAKEELWANDYDTLLKLDPSDWSIVAQSQLQPSEGIARAFIGPFSFSADESLCIVPRPFSGDVIALSTDSFDVTHATSVGGQPLEAALLRSGILVVRQRQTGAVVQTRLKPV